MAAPVARGRPTRLDGHQGTGRAVIGLAPFRALEPRLHGGVRLGVVGLCRPLRTPELARFRLVVVTIAGLRSSLAGADSSTRSGGTTASALPRFRTTAGPPIATAFRFRGGGL